MRISWSSLHQVYIVTIRDDKDDPMIDISCLGLFKGREDEIKGVDEI